MNILNPAERNYLGPGSVTAKTFQTGLFRVEAIVATTVASVPYSTTFEKLFDSSIVVFYATASGYNAAAGAFCTLDYSIDGVLVFNTMGYTNEALSHKAHVPRIVPCPDTLLGTPAISKGVHDLDITLASGTGDANDGIHVVLFELPDLRSPL